MRTYNFNLAVDPDLLWKDLGMEPRYPTIQDGIPAVAVGRPALEVLQVGGHHGGVEVVLRGEGAEVGHGRLVVARDAAEVHLQ